ncbi:MAG: 2-phospho-L-lactate transferase [Theionarchaea archaeon]|nr:2-phospho-L-lactate transferase [Theionarchaea archaeon]MBU7037244.1 2-phospho-L-lactate transferase [Theionarchaea archaeon]
MLCILSGGTGTPKLLTGISGNYGVVVNTGEDLWISGVYVSPDLDTVVYTLAGMVDDSRWYGQKEDTYFCHEMMKALGHTELLRIGDKDRGLKLFRTLLMKKGVPLSQVTQRVLKALTVKVPVFPMSDDKVTTRIHTEREVLTFHEFWVARRAQVAVTGVEYEGIETARPVGEALDLMKESEAILVGPSNPVTSIGPIMGMKAYRNILQKKVVVGISPMVGDAPFSGPTATLMRGLGIETTCVGVARMYQDFLDIFIIHETDSVYKPVLEDMGLTVYVEDILLDSPEKKKALWRVLEGIV